MTGIAEVAIAYWRLCKWLDETDAEHKLPAESALRKINRFLRAQGIEIVDVTGRPFDGGLSVEVVGGMPDEDGLDDRPLVVTRMVQPIVLQNGELLSYGQIIVGRVET
ncbi:MAG: hypothetical protein IJQ12_00800 [Lachnospiraceae bacterium]|nr:hypothetical protein [Lachnospiraceae bacterium]